MISEGQMDSVVLFNLQHPRSILGPRSRNGKTEIIAYLPLAVNARVVSGNKRHRMEELRDKIYRASIQGTLAGGDYEIEFEDESGYTHRRHDPYAFESTISDDDLYLFKRGELHYSYRTLGAHTLDRDGIHGTVFRVWAPNARGVSVVGNFNHWTVGCNPMENVQESGIWELFIPDIGGGELYKFAVKSATDGQILMKVDPYAFRMELRPHNASVVYDEQYDWNDTIWMNSRCESYQTEPVAIYEVHLGSWKKEKGEFMNYREIAPLLLEHLRKTGFNFVELMPVMEHPLDASWGYQVTNYYSPSSRNGTPSDFRYFVDFMHQNGIGVVLDWVPAHFPADDFGLSMYDGTHLYEHEDPRRGQHPDWGTLIFNYTRNEVHNFLFSNAIYWVEEFHADGLRIDAVSSMLYLNYSRKDGEWLPNEYGGNENLEAIEFLRNINDTVHSKCPGIMMVAEESTAWPGVTRSTQAGGLGFDFKWNMGWMHDTLSYFAEDPVHRKYHQNELTFAMWYAFNEDFMLPISHDEVVHGKGSLYGKMPGDPWRKFANVRLCLAYMYSFPGKKLLFMGSEIAQEREWDYAGEIDWSLLENEENSGIVSLVSDLNRVYRNTPSMYEQDCNSNGFEWIDFSDAENSVISFIRYGTNRDDFTVCVFNFTPVPRHDYRIGVPKGGNYREVINTDSEFYGGSGQGNYGSREADNIMQHGRDHSLNLTLPPLGALILQPE